MCLNVQGFLVRQGMEGWITIQSLLLVIIDGIYSNLSHGGQYQ